MKDPREEKNVPYCKLVCNATAFMTNQAVVVTNDYVFEEDGVYEDTSNTDWERAFYESHYTISELLNVLKVYLNDDLKTAPIASDRRLRLIRMLEDCEGWKTEKETYEEG